MLRPRSMYNIRFNNVIKCWPLRTPISGIFICYFIYLLNIIMINRFCYDIPFVIITRICGFRMNSESLRFILVNRARIYVTLETKRVIFIRSWPSRHSITTHILDIIRLINISVCHFWCNLWMILIHLWHDIFSSTLITKMINCILQILLKGITLLLFE